MRARAKGMALSTSVNWISNFVIAFITPPLFSAMQGGYYFLLLGFCAISGVFVYFVYPETAGKTLEELGEVFGDRVLGVASVGLNDAGARVSVTGPREDHERREAALMAILKISSRRTSTEVANTALADSSELTLTLAQPRISKSLSDEERSVEARDQSVPEVVTRTDSTEEIDLS